MSPLPPSRTPADPDPTIPIRPDPVRPADPDARRLALDLLAAARHTALAVIGEDGAPVVTRVALGRDAAELPMLCLSGLAAHTTALARDPRASILVGEPGPKGDPLVHPRLTLQVRAEPTDPAEREALAALWLASHPKAAIYLGLPDFRFLRLRPVAAFLNGGFGRAYRLTPEDLGCG